MRVNNSWQNLHFGWTIPLRRFSLIRPSALFHVHMPECEKPRFWEGHASRELCFTRLFEFHDCSSTNCGLEWSGSEEHSLFSISCIRPTGKPHPPSFPSTSLTLCVGQLWWESEGGGKHWGHEPPSQTGGWQTLPIEWQHWDSANHGLGFFTRT